MFAHSLAKTTEPGRHKARPLVHTPKALLKQRDGAEASRAPHPAAFLQTKVAIGPANDHYEREADRVADNVVANRDAGPITRLGAEPGVRRKGEEEEETLQARRIQRKGEEEEEALQAKRIQRKGEEEEEALQAKRIQRKGEEEEEALQAKRIQRKGEEEEETLQAKRIQRKGEEEEETLQAKRIQRKGEEEEETLQAKRIQRKAQNAAMEAAADRAISSHSAGEPLQSDTRQRLEGTMGTDLGDVRVHGGSGSHEANRAMNARAFTYGNNIWLGAGESQSDLHLMAHEATHVVQQTGRVQRATGTSPPANPGSAPTSTASNDKGSVDISQKKITIPNVPLPAIKANKAPYKGGRTFFRAAGYNREGDNNPKQIKAWEKHVSGEGAKNILKGPPFNLTDETRYIVSVSKMANKDRFGNAEVLANALKRPAWRENGKAQTHDVDHIVELQLAGWPKQSWGNDPAINMELLDSETNQQSGRIIKKQAEDKVKEFLETDEAKTSIPAPRGIRAIKKNYDIYYTKFTPNASLNPKTKPSVWSVQDINQGKHIDVLKNISRGKRSVKIYDLKNPKPAKGSPFHGHNKSEESYIGSESTFALHWYSYGGRRAPLDWPDPTTTSRPATKKDRNKLFMYGIYIDEIHFHPKKKGDKVGKLKGIYFKKQKDKSIFQNSIPADIDVKRLPGTEFAGYLDYLSLLKLKNAAIEAAGLSPIGIDEIILDPEKGLVIMGYIQATLPIIKDTRIALILEGDDLRAEKEFELEDLKLPGPIKATESNLTVSLGTKSGLGVKGETKLEVERMGKGYVKAAAGKKKGFELEGGFDFDSKLFDPAAIKLAYKDKKFSGEGELGIPKGKVKGIKTANLKVAVDDGNWNLDGSVEPDIPGVSQGTLKAKYDKEKGLDVKGSLALTNDIPGIKGGSIEAGVRQKKDGEGWDLEAKGTAQPDIPGVTADIGITYKNGLFLIQGNAAYKKGMLDGSIKIGATNAVVNAEGKITDQIGDKLTAFGGGTVGIQIAPWLKGTIGLNLLPNGQIEVLGKVELPSTLDIFPEKKFEKQLLSVNLDIPIIGVSVLGQRIGVFATVGGSLTAKAGFGPGQLKDLGLEVLYNPDKEDETVVKGGGKFAVPAFAGLRLEINGGLGAGIPVVSAEVGLKVGGEIGLKGEALAQIAVNWTPKTGLILDAKGSLMVTPKFLFDISAYAQVKADLYLKTIHFIDKKWTLAKYEYGPDMQFGMVFPIHYEEGKPFDISYEDIQLIKPNIKPLPLLKGLVKDIV